MLQRKKQRAWGRDGIFLKAQGNLSQPFVGEALFAGRVVPSHRLPFFFLQGHVEELWGLATHPGRAQFVTCGQDKLVHMWSSETHQPLWSRTIEVMGWECRYGVLQRLLLVIRQGSVYPVTAACGLFKKSI